MVALMGQNSTQAKLGMKSEIIHGGVILTLPIRTVSELNCSDHWRVKHKRHVMQQKSVEKILKPVKNQLTIPFHVHLTRLAPRKLNRHDNLPASMKYIVDAVCAIITGDYRPGRADDDERLQFSYDQETSSQYAVIIKITNLELAPE